MHFWYQVGDFDAKVDTSSLFLVLQTTEFVTAVENNFKKMDKTSPFYISLFCYAALCELYINCKLLFRFSSSWYISLF